jgi:hypothetical protein
MGELTSIPISRGGITINHLLFADDNLLFCRANNREWEQIQRLLTCYEASSGQKINREKTSIFFSRNTKMEARAQILNVAGVPSTQQYERYIGLPALIGRLKISTFNGTIGRIWSKINGWKENFLSHADKEILLKAVIQVIPTYTMSVFQLPKMLSRDINFPSWQSFGGDTKKMSTKFLR